MTLIHIGRTTWACATDTCSPLTPCIPLAIDSSLPARHFGPHSFHSCDTTQTELTLWPVQFRLRLGVGTDRTEKQNAIIHTTALTITTTSNCSTFIFTFMISFSNNKPNTNNNFQHQNFTNFCRCTNRNVLIIYPKLKILFSTKLSHEHTDPHDKQLGD